MLREALQTISEETGINTLTKATKRIYSILPGDS